MIGDGNFISQVPLFGGLDDAQQVSLQQKMGHTTLRRGETGPITRPQMSDTLDPGDLVTVVGPPALAARAARRARAPRLPRAPPHGRRRRGRQPLPQARAGRPGRRGLTRPGAAAGLGHTHFDKIFKIDPEPRRF